MLLRAFFWFPIPCFRDKCLLTTVGWEGLWNPVINFHFPKSAKWMKLAGFWTLQALLILCDYSKLHLWHWNFGSNFQLVLLLLLLSSYNYTSCAAVVNTLSTCRLPQSYISYNTTTILIHLSSWHKHSPTPPPSSPPLCTTLATKKKSWKKINARSRLLQFPYTLSWIEGGFGVQEVGSLVEATKRFENDCWFWNGGRWAKVEGFWPWRVFDLRELGL